MSKHSITIEINGESFTQEVDSRKLLIHFLRDDLALTGTHIGCDTSSCGACTVLMNGEPVRSCITFAVVADGTEITTIEGFDEDIAEELRARAKDALLTMAIASEEELGSNEPAQDLLEMRGMDKQLAYVLASMSVITMEDLAEQSVDELMDIEGMTEEWAAELIMTAREPWFAEEGESA